MADTFLKMTPTTYPISQNEPDNPPPTRDDFADSRAVHIHRGGGSWARLLTREAAKVILPAGARLLAEGGNLSSR